MIQKTLGELGEYLGGRVVGDPALVITGIAGLHDAGAGDVSYVLGEKNLTDLGKSDASAVIAPEALDFNEVPSVRVRSVPEAVEGAKRLFRPPIEFPPGIHETAIISDAATIGDDVTIMPYVVIQEGAFVGDGTVIYPAVYVGHESVVGCHCLIYPNAVIRERVTLGDHSIVHAGAVIGADGFGFVAGEIPHRKIAQVGTVEVGESAEIGANTTIDRATLGRTSVGPGTKIDNLVQIAHNVAIDKDCLISSQTGIAGSTRVGANVILGGQVGVGDHIVVGDQVVVAAKSGVTKSAGPGQVLYGNPAGLRMEKQREAVSIRKLPELVKKVKDLERRLSEIEKNHGTG